MIYYVWCMMYDVRCMMYDVWCMMYNVWCIMYNVLAKFVVGGLQPGNDTWKMLLRLRFAYFRPRKGVNWAPQTGRILNMDLKPSFSCQLEDRFSASMWKAWCDIRRGLKCDQPSFEPAWLSQRVLWNPCIKDESNQLLGSRGCHGDTLQKV